MSQQDKFNDILASLHKAALDDIHWRATSALIDDACEIGGSHLCIIDGLTLLFDQVYYRGELRTDLRDDYVNNYFAQDERVPRVMRLPDSQMVRACDVYTELERKASPTYNELLVRTGARNGLQMRMDLDGPNELDIVWVTANPSGPDGWNTSQIDMIQRLLPHVRQFVRVRQALAGADALNSSLTALLDDAMVGVIYLGRRGVILETNTRAREILRRADGLQDRDGVLRGSAAADDARLGRLLADALPGHGRQPVSGSMTVERSLLLPRLVVHVNPIPAGPMDFGARSAVVLVLLVDPGARTAIDADLVAATFRLTRAESQVAAALAEGNTVREIAAATFRAESSVRWLVKQIHAKLGISRQADLVRLVLSAHHVPNRSP